MHSPHVFYFCWSRKLLGRLSCHRPGGRWAPDFTAPALMFDACSRMKSWPGLAVLAAAWPLGEPQEEPNEQRHGGKTWENLESLHRSLSVQDCFFARKPVPGFVNLKLRPLWHRYSLHLAKTCVANMMPSGKLAVCCRNHPINYQRYKWHVSHQLAMLVYWQVMPTVFTHRLEMRCWHWM